MVCFDATVLVDLFDERLVGDRRARLDLLIEDLEKRREKVAIPAPAYTEFLVGAGKARDEYQKRIEKSGIFRIEPFATRAALECSILLADAFSAQQKRAVTRTKFKYDWMIVAIARASQAVAIYTRDDDILRSAQICNLQCKWIDDLPLPQVHPQTAPLFEEARQSDTRVE